MAVEAPDQKRQRCAFGRLIGKADNDHGAKIRFGSTVSKPIVFECRMATCFKIKDTQRCEKWEYCGPVVRVHCAVELSLNFGVGQVCWMHENWFQMVCAREASVCITFGT